MAIDSRGDFEVTAELDHELSALAVQSMVDDSGAIELFGLLAWKIERFVDRFRYWDLDPYELDDVAQESYLVFLDTLHRWKATVVGGRPTGYLFYFLKVFPLWLATAVRRWRRPARSPSIRQVHQQPPDSDLDDDAVIAHFCRNLSFEEAQLVRLRVVEDCSIPIAAKRMGMARRTAYRRWRRVVEYGRLYLREAG